MIKSYILHTVSWLIAFLLLTAAWSKLTDLNRFKSNLIESFGFSFNASRIVAPIIIILELLLFITIASDTVYSHYAMGISFVVFIVFTIFLLHHWLKNARVKCSCFGEDDRPVSIFDIIRNILVVCLVGCFLLLKDDKLPVVIEFQLVLIFFAFIIHIILIHLHDISMIILTSKGKL